MTQDAKTIIPDTNILLHYPPIDQIDWLQWCESESVKIVFCLKVIQELDRKKDDPLLYERAKSAIKKIKELSDANGYIKDGVSGEIHTKDIEAHTSADETIIQQALDYQSSHPEEHIYIMSEDLGMQVCCRKCTALDFLDTGL